MSDNVFRFLAACILLIMLGTSAYYRSRADRLNGGRASLKEEGLAIMISLRVVGFALWLCVVAFLIDPDWVAWARIDLPEWTRWLGIALGIAADFLAAWIFRTLGTNVTPTVVTRPAHTLVTGGPYRWVRHPLYSMGAMAFLGFALIAENWGIALAALLVFVVLVIRTDKEAANLIQRFGDEYRAYMKRTGRFLPMI